MNNQLKYMITGAVIAIVGIAIGMWLMKETGHNQSQANVPMMTTGNKPHTVTDDKGRVSSYIYDDKGRPVSVMHPDGTRENFAYDVNGNLIKPTTK